MDEAEAAYKGLIAKNPGSPSSTTTWDTSSLKKDSTTPEASFLKALELKPDYSEARSALDKVYQDSGQAAKVPSSTRRRRPPTRRPEGAVPSRLLDFNSNKLDEAEAAFKKVEAIDPDNARPSTTWARSR